MAKHRKDTSKKARNAAAHAAYMAAVAAGHRPLRASTFTDRRKEASRKACRGRQDSE